MPEAVRHRHSNTPDPGAGPGRIRDSLASPQWTPDRKSDRSSADDRSGDPGRHAGALRPHYPCPLYRLPFGLLADLPPGEDRHAVWDERRFGARLWILRGHPRSGLSSLQRWLSLRQACQRPNREARLHCLQGEELPPNGKRLPLDAADCERGGIHAGDVPGCN